MSDAGPIYESMSGKRRRVLSEIGSKTNNIAQKTENTGTASDCAASQKENTKTLDLESARTVGVVRKFLPNIGKVDTAPNAESNDSESQGDILTQSPGMSPQLALAKPHMNSQGSSIPTLRKNDRFERFLTINKSLNRKSSISGLNGDFPNLASSPGSFVTLDPKAGSTHKAWEEEMQESKQLDEQIRQATVALAHKQEEAYTLQKLHKALEDEHTYLEKAIEENREKLECLSDQVTLRVEAQEIEAQKHIDELRGKARDSYNNVRSEVKSELEKALQAESSETAQEVALLETTKAELEAEMAQKRRANEEIIEAKKAQIQAALDTEKRKVNDEIAVAEAELKNLTLQHEAVDQENRELEGSLSSQEKNNQRIKEQIALLENTIQQQNMASAQLEAQIDQENEQLAAQQAINVACAKKEAAARIAYDAEKEKYDAYITTRRGLEHAISKISDKKRILVRVGGECASNEVGMDERFGGEVALGKITAYVANDTEYSGEWRLLVQEALSGTLISILFLGSPQKDIQAQVADICSFLHEAQGPYWKNGWEFTFHLQSVCVENKNTIFDLVDSSVAAKLREGNDILDIASAKIAITSGSEIYDVYRSAASSMGIYVHVISVDGTNAGGSKRVFGKITLIDISNLSLQTQIDHLTSCIGPDGGNSSYVSEVLGQRRANFTSLDVCDIEDIQAPGATDILDAVKNRAY